jgi:hypothetical protein
MDERKLPSSGRIALTDVMSEFQLGANNMLSYAGAAAGVPSTPPLRLSDFYGKEMPNYGVPVEGSYSGKSTMAGGNYDGTGTLIYFWYQGGVGQGDRYPFSDTAGVSTLSAAGSDPTDVDSQAYWPVLVHMGEPDKAAAFYNNYSQLRVETVASGGYNQNYSGTWYAYTQYTSSQGYISVVEFSNQAAGKHIARAVEKEGAWSISLQG